jgi:hypothetical protein
LLRRLVVLNEGDLREQPADVVGVLGVTLDVLGDRRVLTAAEPLGELLGQPLDGIETRSGFAPGASTALLERRSGFRA